MNGAIDGECFGERCCERACILLEFVYVYVSPEVDFSACRFCSMFALYLKELGSILGITARGSGLSN